MKFTVLLILFSAMSFSTLATASTVICNSNITLQQGTHLKTDGELSFDLVKNDNRSVITNISGHIFVKGDSEDQNESMGPDDSYRGFFNTAKIEANLKYRPNKYKGFAQFKNLNASRTDGQEEGMWGDFSVDVSGENTMSAYYIFRAGDHMGGTVIFSCHEK